VTGLAWLPGLLAQCLSDDLMPDGCAGDDSYKSPDPQSCFMYYKCTDSCVTHETCEDGERYDDRHNWCDYGYDVDCGSRPCDDVAHCSTRPPTTTPEPDCTPPEQEIDCTGLKGYVPDPYNCRRYWQCDPGLPKIHFLCPDDENGHPEMFDTVYDGCNYDYLTECGSRPVCDKCNANCGTTHTTLPTTDDCSPPEWKIDCSVSGAGYFPDPHNCRRYWHCRTDEDEAPEHALCPDDPATGVPEVFDLLYSGCNYQDLTECGERPVCDPCGANCVTKPPGPDIDCDHELDCSSKPDGYYADPFSCPKYWQCSGGRGQHHICPEGQMYDPGHVWCDYTDRVQCGSRPHCNECEPGCP